MKGDIFSRSENKAIKTIIWAGVIVLELYGLIKNHTYCGFGVTFEPCWMLTETVNFIFFKGFTNRALKKSKKAKED